MTKHHILESKKYTNYMEKTRLQKNPAITLVIYQAPKYFQDFFTYVRL